MTTCTCPVVQASTYREDNETWPEESPRFIAALITKPLINLSLCSKSTGKPSTAVVNQTTMKIYTDDHLTRILTNHFASHSIDPMLSRIDDGWDFLNLAGHLARVGRPLVFKLLISLPCAVAHQTSFWLSGGKNPRSMSLLVPSVGSIQHVLPIFLHQKNAPWWFRGSREKQGMMSSEHGPRCQQHSENRHLWAFEKALNQNPSVRAKS